MVGSIGISLFSLQGTLPEIVPALPCSDGYPWKLVRSDQRHGAPCGAASCHIVGVHSAGTELFVGYNKRSSPHFTTRLHALHY